MENKFFITTWHLDAVRHACLPQVFCKDVTVKFGLQNYFRSNASLQAAMWYVLTTAFFFSATFFILLS